MTAWDAIDYARETMAALRIAVELRDLREEAQQIGHELALIETILAERDHAV